MTASRAWAARGPVLAVALVSCAWRSKWHEHFYPPSPPVVTRFVLGEGWGCLMQLSGGMFDPATVCPETHESILDCHGTAGWYCWQAGAAGQAPRAAEVHWMEGYATEAGKTFGNVPSRAVVGTRMKGNAGFVAGPDRVCGLVEGMRGDCQRAPDEPMPPQCEATHPDFICWQRPDSEQRAARELDDGFAWRHPNGPQRRSAPWAPDPLSAVMGGTFACLKGTNHALWCQGDDVFGQRARAVAPVDEIALGTWHGCARSDGSVRCWGRGDGGQLGVPAPDRCLTESGDEVACARTPRPVPALSVSGPIALGAGDLFTCLGDGAGIRCWGAARDGFFGKPAACDPRLVTAWPTRQGPVAAPRAGCAALPEHIAGTERLAGKTPPDFDVGPRGLCVLRGGRVECRGAIPSPRAAGLTQLKVSPGSDAAACAMAGGDVVCWGEGYSPPAAPGAPVEVARVAIQKRIPDSIVCKIDYDHATVEGPEIEVYVLLAINKHLRHFPDFAATVADKPIRDCATARAYVKAYAVYLAAHPDFDAHEPYDDDE